MIWWLQRRDGLLWVRIGNLFARNKVLVMPDQSRRVLFR